MDTVDRIFALLDSTTMEQQEFAALVGVSDDTASNWRRRKSGSYAKKIAKIAEVLNTTPEYLLTGQEAAQTAHAGDAEMMAFMAALGEFTPEERERIKGYIEGLLAQRK